MYYHDDYYFIINEEEKKEVIFLFFIICFIEDKYKPVRFLIGRNREKRICHKPVRFLIGRNREKRICHHHRSIHRGNNNNPYPQPQNKRVILPFFSFPKKMSFSVVLLRYVCFQKEKKTLPNNNNCKIVIRRIILHSLLGIAYVFVFLPSESPLYI